MGKKGGNKNGSPFTSVPQSKITLREEIHGRKQLTGGSNNVKSVLKMQQLQNLATWPGGEASIPSLAALFGHRLASCAEAMGTPLDPSLFPCQRCESILQPGYNCTVRIEKNEGKGRRHRKKSGNPTQNNVVYTCHFCSHRNLKRGTPKGHMKEICRLKPKSVSKIEPLDSSHPKSSSLKKEIESIVEDNKKMEEIFSKHEAVSGSKSNGPDFRPNISGEIPIDSSPATPFVRMGLLLERKGKRRKKSGSGSGSNKSADIGSTSGTNDVEQPVTGSSKRRRKSWSTLKEIAESSEHKASQNITNLTIPFLL